MNNYETELQSLKSWDEVQVTHSLNADYDYIETAGHAYLIVPRSDPNYSKAKKICECGFIGRLAVYLEEDCEWPEFIKLISKIGR